MEGTRHVIGVDEALTIARAGYAVLPPRNDGTKAPAIPWRKYEHQPPDEATITEWYGRGRDGIGIICGASSGNLEMLELEGRAVEDGMLDELYQRAEEHGLSELLYRVTDAYMERSPSGGVHILYRVDGPAKPNTKLAMRPGDPAPEVLIETRGQGGFTIVAPSGGRTHPTGEPWSVLCGSILDVVTITPIERDTLHALCATFDVPLHREPTEERPPRTTTIPAGEGWFDAVVADYNDRTRWAQVLDGWTEHHAAGNVTYWTRPGKDPRHGPSATTNAKGTDRLIIFSSSCHHGLEPWSGTGPATSYDRFSYHAIVDHNGDRVAAARSLRAEGYGPPPATPAPRPRPKATPASTAPAEWPTPQPLPQAPPPAPWPRGVLPDWMEAQVDNVARAMQCAPDMPAMFGLGALSVISLGQVEVEPRPGHLEPTALYLVTSLPPSEAKSPAQGAMFDPVADFQDEVMAHQARARAAAAAAHKILDKKAQRAEDSAAISGDPAAIKAAQDARIEADTATMPPGGRLITSDITPERLGTLMADNAERMAIVSDEAGVLQVDRYGDKRGGGVRNLDVYLKAWSGRPATIDRQTAPSILLRRPLLSIVVASQPDAWRRVLGDEELRNRGFTARFMASSPAPMAGRRTVDLDLDQWDTEVAATYAERLLTIARRLHAHQHPLRTKLDTSARRTWSTWAQGLERRLGEGGDLEAEAGWIGKMRDSVIRAAALLHIADDTNPGEAITGATMARAIRIGDYWLAHRLAGLDEVVEGAGSRRVLGALARLSAATEDGIVTRRDLARGGPRGLRTTDEVLPAIQILEQYGWVRLVGTEGARDLPIAGRWRSCKGLQVHPVARESGDPADARQCATSATNRTERKGGTRDTDAERETSRVSRMSAIGTILPPPPSSYPQGEREPPGTLRDTRDNDARHDTRTCTRCGEEKPAELFRWIGSRQRHQARCRPCEAAQKAEHRHADDEPPFDPAYDEPHAYEETTER